MDEHAGGTAKHMVFCNELSSSLVMQATNFRCCLSMNELILVVFLILMISSFLLLYDQSYFLLSLGFGISCLSQVCFYLLDSLGGTCMAINYYAKLPYFIFCKN